MSEELKILERTLLVEERTINKELNQIAGRYLKKLETYLYTDRRPPLCSRK